MRRIERLINLIAALLETRRPLTAAEIRERISGYGDEPTAEAFRRAFERDKGAIRDMGIPLEVVPTGHLGGEPEGYVIPKDKYYLPDLDLEPDELAALRIAANALLGATETAEAGFLKLAIDEVAAPAAGPRVSYGADVAAEQPLLVPLYAAVTERSSVTFTYQRADGEVSERKVDPYGLVHRRGNWYVVGRDETRDGIRAFKVSRIRGQVTARAGTFDVPEGFSAADHVIESFELGDQEPRDTTIRFAPSLRWWAEQNLHDARSREAADGSLDVTIPASNLDAVVSWAIGFGDEVEIVNPPEARALLLERLRPYLEGAT